MLRKLYRKQLIKLVQKVLEKHNPKIIAVMGNGQTSIARELTYKVINEKYPARRSLEAPESEFNLPLTILGWETYPNNALEWLKVLIKSSVSLKHSKKNFHFLILEINFLNPDLLKDWLTILQPETVLIVGGIPLDYSVFDFKKVVKITGTPTEDLIGPFKIAVRQIGRFYRIENELMESVFESFTIPSSKIRYFPGKNGALILDATHHQSPVGFEAINDMLENADERIIVFSDIPSDKTFSASYIFNPKDFVPQNTDLIVLRGKRDQTLQNYSYLLADDFPLS